ncbi:hypothetical protein GGH92_008485, partial [Coemansia sp. RSA 2673]
MFVNPAVPIEISTDADMNEFFNNNDSGCMIIASSNECLLEEFYTLLVSIKITTPTAILHTNKYEGMKFVIETDVT